MASREPQWTEAQQHAIDAPKPGSRASQTLLVAAAAGSGKTAVLVERILQKLQDETHPLAINELLVLTFTKAAAQEMKSRIGTKIAETYSKTHSAYLEEQLNLLPSAHISTIHSFCQWLIQSYFYRLDLDPSLRVGSEGEIKLLEREVLEAYLHEAYEMGQAEVLLLSNRFNKRADDEALIGLIQSTYTFSRAQENPSIWLDEVVNAYRVSDELPIEKQVWGRYFMKRLHEEIDRCLVRLGKMQELLCRGAEWGKSLPAMQSEFQTIVEKMAAITNWDDMVKAVALLKKLMEEYPRASKPKKGNIPSEEELEEYIYLASQNKEFFSSFWDRKSYRWQSLFMQDSSFWNSELRKQAPIMEALVKVVNDFDTAYRKRKQEEGLIDFSDMEHMALALLTERVEYQQGMPIRIPSLVAKELQSSFKAVMVDEYQDTNGVQEAIVNLVGSKDNRFYVGDLKQSIYSFRAADPTLFLEKYNTFTKDLEGEERRIDLAKNFRSHENILEATNFLFSQIMTKEAVALSYGKEEALYAGKLIKNPPEQWIGGNVELHMLEVPRTMQTIATEQDSEEESLTAIEQEAQFVVQQLIKLQKEGALVLDGASSTSYHPIRWSDVVILLRSIKGTANVFVDALRNAGIPAYAEDRTGYFETIEIQLLLSLLQIIDNPEQDLPMASVLRSPLVGLVGNELAQIRLYLDTYSEEAGKQGRECTFWWGISELVSTGQGASILGTSFSKLVSFKERLEEWRTLSRHNSVSDLLWHIYEDTHFVEFVSAMTNGIARRANVLAFYERAKEFERGNFRGIFRFLRFVESLRDAEEDMAPAQIVGAADNVVRIMSIHKSKGLEFPIVFLCGLGKRFNMQDLSEDALFHQGAGIGLLGYHETYRMTYPSTFWFYIRELKLQELKAEEERILYVALTRAKDKLYLVGNTPKLNVLMKRMKPVLEEKHVALSKAYIWEEQSYLGWIVKALMRHPKSTILRKWVGEVEGIPVSLPWATSRWSISAYEPYTFKVKAQEFPDLTDLARIQKLELYQATPFPTDIIDRMHYEYPFVEATKTAAKISVSEMKRRFIEDQEDEKKLVVKAVPKKQEEEILPVFAKKPSFLKREEPELKGAKHGILMHTIMQQLPIKYYNEPYLKLALHDLKEQGIISKEEAKSLVVSEILAFYKSDIGRRMLAAYEADAKNVERELSFSMLLEGQDIYPNLEEGEEVFLQGIMDLVFEEEGEWVLVDYKTDFVPPEREAREFLLDRYKIQLEVYAKALAQITGKKVKEKIIYSFRHGAIYL